MNIKKQKRGFTLVEVLIASTIFTILSIMATQVFVSVVRIQNRIILENQIYEDARFMMEKIAREVRNNTIDYEEYYRENCANDTACNALTNRETFGSLTGCYAQQFYHPGTGGTDPATGLGALCNDGITPANPSCIVNKTTLDINSGQNPYTNPFADHGPETASAVCDEWNRPNATLGLPCSDPSFHERNNLFLINADGSIKTFIGLQKTNDDPVEHAAAMIKMYGTDPDGDGVKNQWYNPTSPVYGSYSQCLPGYDCTNTASTTSPGLRPIYYNDPRIHTLEYSMENISGNDRVFIFRGLVPITPLRTNITSLKFYVAPLEDPRKAFAETDPAQGITQQPHVTIVMTVQPAATELRKFIGEDPPTVTLQSTVASRVYREVKTYTGKNECP